MTNSVQVFKQGIRHDLQLRGHTVALEPMAIEHIDSLNQAAADGELWNLNYTSVPTAEAMQDMVDSALKQRSDGNELPFVVRRLSDQKIVGSTRYYLIEPMHRNLSIGYTWYAQSAQRTSINTECKLLLLTYAFETLKCISVQWHTDDQNIRSQQAIQRLGAKFEGILRNNKIMPDGRYRNTHCYSMLDNEWANAKKFLKGCLAKTS